MKPSLMILFATILLVGPARGEGPITVKVERSPSGYQLLRGGQPFLIKGAGGRSYLDVLKEAGGNSIRTWGEDDLEPLLDRANELGLTVTIGIWLGQPRQGCNYADPSFVRSETEKSIRFFRRYKNHPALLMWGLGNEMEGDGNDPNIWKTVNEIARIAHREDPGHPTMIVIAELGGKKLDMYRTLCPDVDVLGINSYAGLHSLGERIEKARFDRPYVVTEFGPPGPWEVGQTGWKAPIEPSSTNKAEAYRRNYARSIAGYPGKCLGSYAFFWGNKQEATSTWFGLFLASGERLEAVDVLTEAWTGHPPANHSPRIREIHWDGKEKTLLPGTRQKATVVTDDPDRDTLTVRWEIRSESMDRREGGDREAEPPPHPESFIHARGLDFEFKTPTRSGPCRLFVFVYDGKGNAATANVPFLVQPSKE